MHVLIVDPEDRRTRQLRAVLKVLRGNSARIETIGSITAGPPSLRREPFHCCFLAARTTGPDLVDAIAGLRTKAVPENLPVIVYGPDSTRENVLGAGDAGAAAFLTYPFTAEAVEAVLNGLGRL